MKNLVVIFSLMWGAASIAQIQKVDTQHAKLFSMKVDKLEHISPVKSEVAHRILDGSYTVDSYYVLSTDTPSNKKLKELIGSEITLTSTAISGSEIETFNVEPLDFERMSRGDYIYRNFGRSIRAPEPDLPDNLNVYKTGNLDCYGIIALDNGDIAIPYKGVLLILKRLK